MTYKEKLMKERPDRVSNKFLGGCDSCPGHYWKGAPECNVLNCGNFSELTCSECWNSVIPGTEKEECLYPKCILSAADIDMGAMVTKCIEAKKRLIYEGDCKPSEAVALVNSILRMYGRHIVGLDKEEQK